MEIGKNKGFDFGRMAFGCILVAFAIALVCLTPDAFVAPSLKGYETVPCRIDKSSVKMEAVNKFVFTAEFTYEHLGRTYKSNSLRRPNQRKYEFTRLASRLPLLERYAPGTEHKCLVNPVNPFDAVLSVNNPAKDPDEMPDDIGSIVAVVALALFLFVGAFMILSAFPSVRRLGATPRVKKMLGALGLVLFGLAFMTVGSFVLVRHVRERSEAKSCVPVPAKVLYSGVYSFRTGGRHPHTSHSVRVGYEYTIDGRKYESDRLEVSWISSGNIVAGRYKKGDAVTAYVSRDDPRMSFLVKSSGFSVIGAIVFVGVFGVAFGVVGFAAMAGGIWMICSFLRGALQSRGTLD